MPQSDLLQWIVDTDRALNKISSTSHECAKWTQLTLPVPNTDIPRLPWINNDYIIQIPYEEVSFKFQHADVEKKDGTVEHLSLPHSGGYA